ncbi:hypothetical protein OE88DRAFT_1656877 [Heliocybe sulcata]|uniref:Uncharacterized protein n=1 Tax=Heliocybe sulcata TaxID=5364 RepID=A0A5C3N6P2_9AGAM|nr:hypothetical protein OE88DRAFT_1656877 [Heliocybe sulcata]
MFKNLLTFTILALFASSALAAPLVEEAGLSRREPEPGRGGYNAPPRERSPEPEPGRGGYNKRDDGFINGWGRREVEAGRGGYNKRDDDFINGWGRREAEAGRGGYNKRSED